MRRIAVLVSAAAVCGLLVATLPAASALGAPQRGRAAILTIKKLGGAAVKPGAILEGGLKKGTTATFAVSGGGSVTCKSVTFKDKVDKNPTAPGKSNESLIQQTFVAKSCTAKNIQADPSGLVTSVVVSVSAKHPLPTTISDAKGLPVTVSGTDATITVPSSVGSIHCEYAAHKNTTVGHASNKTESITFADQPFHLVHSAVGCPTSGSFSATFAPVKDTSVKGDPDIFVN
jgi:hypothetical protein